MFETTLAGSLPKPGWLAETDKLWPQWRAQGEELIQAKKDATLLWLKTQEDAGLDIVGDGEQARQHFVHGFLEAVEGIDFVNKVKMGIRNNRYEAMVPQVVGPLRLKGRVHALEAQLARAHTRKKLKFTLPGPMTIVDTVADRYYGEGEEGRIKMAFAFAELLNQEALALQADGVDIIQFDEPAFNVYLEDAADWGVKALERAAQGLTCTTAVHICYGYGIQANIDWKQSLGHEWRQYEKNLPRLGQEPNSAGEPGVLPLPRAHVAHGLARRQGRDGGGDRCGERDGGDARASGRDDWPGLAIRAQAPPLSLHQLRHGPHATRGGRGQTARLGRGCRNRTRAPRLIVTP